ncbi:MAG: DEAD/DEAH box helicase, partial [archaeon]|nr:DEAD/DEAH box helicase [archaeon]
MTSYISHPLIQEHTLERRLYQEVIAAQVMEKGNTLVVAPTALGKTVIAVLVAAHLLQKNPQRKILFLAPTKPLAVQHAARMKAFLTLEEGKINVLTGALSPDKRKALWDTSIIITATPQTIENDVLTGRQELEDVQLLIFDEAHRGVKDYAYVYLAQRYMKIRAPEGKRIILALTASPGSEEETIQDVCKNLFIQHIVVKTMQDPDVKPYVNPINVEWRRVKLPEEYREIKNHLEEFIKEQIHFFKRMGYAQKLHFPHYIKRKDIMELQIQLREDMLQYGNTKPSLYHAVSKVAALLKVTHAITLLESQGVHTLLIYFEKLYAESTRSGSSKAAKLVFENPHIRQAYVRTKVHAETKELEHPKIGLLTRLLTSQFEKNPDSRVLVFNHYRDSVAYVTEALNDHPPIRAARFIGQATKSAKDKGLSQKQQINLLELFREGTYNTLVASSVAEEGLDLPSVDLVIFYEPVPSEIRLIQRRGRTGRKEAGKVIILMAEKTMDEAMYWASMRKEKNMHATLDKLSSTATHITAPFRDQTTLAQHAEEKIIVFADTREQASSVMRELSFYTDVKVHVKQLEVGDFIVGPDVVVERKTVNDFLSSVLDGRLLNQLMDMSQAYARPVILLEGKPEELFTLRNIHEHAIIGMLSTIALTYRIPILFTRDAKESAKFLHQMAKREQVAKDREIRLRLGRKGFTLEEQQQFLVESLPLVGPNLAQSLLGHFGNIQKLTNATLEELEEVEKIGPKKAAAILKVL